MIVNDQCEGHPFIPLAYPISSNSLRSSCFGDTWRRVVPSHTVAVNHQCEQYVEGVFLHLRMFRVVRSLLFFNQRLLSPNRIVHSPCLTASIVEQVSRVSHDDCYSRLPELI